MSPQEYLGRLSRVLTQMDLSVVEQMAEACYAAYRTGGTVFCVGNGGSASTASHLATDLTKLTIVPEAKRRLRALALNESASTLSAVANDICYDEVFAEQLRAFLQPNDVLIGLSTSGSSKNVLCAMRYAMSVGATTIGVTGANGRELRRLATYTLTIDSTSVQHIEDASMVASHLLCMLVRERCLAEVSTPEATAGSIEPVPVSI